MGSIPHISIAGVIRYLPREQCRENEKLIPLEGKHAGDSLKGKQQIGNRERGVREEVWVRLGMGALSSFIGKSHRAVS